MFSIMVNHFVDSKMKSVKGIAEIIKKIQKKLKLI